MKKSDGIKLMFMLFCTASFLSCFGPEERTKMNEEERRLFDSLYTNQINILRKSSDSLCKVLHDSLYATYVDSILELRLIEVEQIIHDR